MDFRLFYAVKSDTSFFYFLLTHRENAFMGKNQNSRYLKKRIYILESVLNINKNLLQVLFIF